MDERKQKEFQKLVKEVTPTHNLGLQMLKAFLVGGVICTLGQFILNMAQNNFGLDKEAAGSWCSLILVFLSVLLTGLNIYPRIAKWGGAGALVPITGFANSVSAPAIEYQKDGDDIIKTRSKNLRKIKGFYDFVQFFKAKWLYQDRPNFDKKPNLIVHEYSYN